MIPIHRLHPPLGAVADADVLALLWIKYRSGEVILITEATCNEYESNDEKLVI